MATIDHAAAYRKEDVKYEISLLDRCRLVAVEYEPPRGLLQWDCRRIERKGLEDSLKRRLYGESPTDNYNRLNRLEDACLMAERLQKEDDIKKSKCNELGVKYHRRPPGGETEDERVDRFKNNAHSIKMGEQGKKRKAMTHQKELDTREMNRIYKRMSRAKKKRNEASAKGSKFGTVVVDLDSEYKNREANRLGTYRPLHPVRNCKDPFCKCICGLADEAKRSQKLLADQKRYDVARESDELRDEEKVSSYLEARGSSIRKDGTKIEQLMFNMKPKDKVDLYRQKQVKMAGGLIIFQKKQKMLSMVVVIRRLKPWRRCL
jgi:hypothetical protein